MKQNILKYLSVFSFYFAFDFTYQILFSIPFSQRMLEAAGIKDIFATEVQNPILILIWFLIMTFAIVKLVVEPAVALQGTPFRPSRWNVGKRLLRLCTISVEVLAEETRCVVCGAQKGGIRSRFFLLDPMITAATHLGVVLQCARVVDVLSS